MMQPPPPLYFGGLDLGQMQDYTAFAVLERVEVEECEPGAPRRRVRRFAVRHLQRWPLRTIYTDIIKHIVELYTKPPLKRSALVVDRTGVGVAVFDQLDNAKPAARLVAATITGGAQTTFADGCWTVPKRELAGTLQVLLGTRRLKVAPELPLAAQLAREMSTFKAKINIATGNESFEAWRERDHDDLVLAVALAAWWGERERPPSQCLPFVIGGVGHILRPWL
jgi:hypothetical protein